jgi:hypothetical protein
MGDNMNVKSLGLLMLIVIFGIAFYFLLPNMKGMKESTAKRNVVSSAKIYGDEIKSLWNSDAIFCDTGGGNYKPTIAIGRGDYYVLVGNNDVNTNLPVVKLDKVNDKYHGYVKIDYTDAAPKYSVFLTDDTYSVMKDDSYSTLSKKDVKKEKLSFTFDSSYHYCKGD